jgi:hypothetical protein
MLGALVLNFSILHAYIMAPSLSKHCILLGLLFIPNISAQSYDRPITDPTDRVNHALSGLGQWYNISTGIWDTAGWWNSANILTMIGDFAQTDPDDAHLQKFAQRTFANAVRKSPKKNPDPTRELPTTNSSVQSRSATPPYRKFLDPRTFQPHSDLPVHWFHHLATRQDTDNTAALLSDNQFDETALLKDFTPTNGSTAITTTTFGGPSLGSPHTTPPTTPHTSISPKAYSPPCQAHGARTAPTAGYTGTTTAHTLTPSPTRSSSAPPHTSPIAPRTPLTT